MRFRLCAACLIRRADDVPDGMCPHCRSNGEAFAFLVERGHEPMCAKLIVYANMPCSCEFTERGRHEIDRIEEGSECPQ